MRLILISLLLVLFNVTPTANYKIIHYPHNLTFKIKPQIKKIVKPIYHIFEVTAYLPTGRRTASGKWPRHMHTIAASRGVPFGTRIYFPELKRTFIVEDRGGMITKGKIDIFTNNYAWAIKLGRRKMKGIILKPRDMRYNKYIN